jgi:aminoglycoside phosphotransferase/predicted kinase
LATAINPPAGRFREQVWKLTGKANFAVVETLLPRLRAAGDPASGKESRILTRWASQHKILGDVLMKLPLTPFDTPAVIDERQRLLELQRREAASGASPHRTPDAELEPIARTVYGTGAGWKNREVWVLVGRQACGKSTLADTLLAREHAMDIDGDRLRDNLPAWHATHSKTVVAKDKSRLGDMVLNMAAKQGDNLVLSYVGHGDIENMRPDLELLRHQNYRIHVVHCNLPVEQAIERSLERFEATGRLVDPIDQLANRNGPAESFDKLILSGLADDWASYDMDVPMGTAPRLESSAASPRPQTAAGGSTLATLAQVRESVAATRSDNGDVAPAARNRLLHSLPEVTQQSLTQFAAAAVGLPTVSVALEALGGGRSAARVWMVKDQRHDGHAVAVVKLTPDPDTFCREVDGMMFLADQQLAGVNAPRVLGLARMQTADGPTGVLAMSLAGGKSLVDRIKDVGEAQGPARTAAMQQLQEGVAASARALAHLHTGVAGSGTRVPLAYMERYRTKLHNETFVKLARHIEGVEQAGLDLDVIKAATAKAWDAMMVNPGTNAVCHGDTHQGNLMVDDHNEVSLIDFNRLHQSLDAAGQPNGSPARDIGKFWYRLRLYGQRLNLRPEEIQALQNTFVTAYRESGGASMTREALHFFTLQVGLEGLALSLRHDDAATITRMAPYQAQNIRALLNGEIPAL